MNSVTQATCLIEKRVFEKYPVTKREKCCAMRKAKMDFLRDALRKRLKNEWEGKTKIFASIPPGEPEV